MNDDENQINQKTVAFLDQASNLVARNLHLVADLDVTSYGYGRRPPAISKKSVSNSSISKKAVSRKSVQEELSSLAPPPKPTEASAQPNSKKRAKSLSKLASLNDEKNRIGSSAGTSSLLSFMNSLKR